MEYKDFDFLSYLKKNRTICHHSCLEPFQYNGRVERKHRHILDILRALLISFSCLNVSEGEAALTTIYMINQMSSLVINNQSLYEKFHGSSPNDNIPNVFSYDCFVLLQPPEHTKLEAWARLCLDDCIRVSHNVTFWKDCSHLCQIFTRYLIKIITYLLIILLVYFLTMFI